MPGFIATAVGYTIEGIVEIRAPVDAFNTDTEKLYWLVAKTMVPSVLAPTEVGSVPVGVVETTRSADRSIDETLAPLMLLAKRREPFAANASELGPIKPGMVACSPPLPSWTVTLLAY